MALRKDVDTVLAELARKSGVSRGELSRRFHRIKRQGAAPCPRGTN
jgi:DNA-binding Lrp family transcriptional regulator